DFASLRARGDAHITVGHHEEAVADFEAALKIEPDDSLALNNLAWLLATSPEDEIRNAKRALEFATRASELTDYKAAHILSTLAAAYAEGGDFAEAIKWSKKSAELNEDPDLVEPLAKELATYEAGQPFRERKKTDEKNAGTEEQAEAAPAAADAQSIDF
ncbi:MAG: tetratricopeptide repeat protein, partial [Planctomycetota bacterium]